MYNIPLILVHLENNKIGADQMLRASERITADPMKMQQGRVRHSLNDRQKYSEDLYVPISADSNKYCVDIG